MPFTLLCPRQLSYTTYSISVDVYQDVIYQADPESCVNQKVVLNDKMLLDVSYKSKKSVLFHEVIYLIINKT